MKTSFSYLKKIAAMRSRIFLEHRLRFNKNYYDIWKKRAKTVFGLNRVTSTGIERIAKDGPLLLTPNHLNWKDIPFIGAMIRRPVSFVATYRLFDMNACLEMLSEHCDRSFRSPGIRRLIYRINGHIARFLTNRISQMGAIPARLQSGEYSLIDSVKAAFHKEKLVCIFPEGKPGNPARLNRFKPGAPRVLLEFYKETGISIPTYPVGLQGTHHFYMPGRKLGIHIGAPLFIGEHIKKTENQTITDFTEVLRGRVYGLMTRQA